MDLLRVLRIFPLAVLASAPLIGCHTAAGRGALDDPRPPAGPKVTAEATRLFPPRREGGFSRLGENSAALLVRV